MKITQVKPTSGRSVARCWPARSVTLHVVRHEYNKTFLFPIFMPWFQTHTKTEAVKPQSVINSWWNLSFAICFSTEPLYDLMAANCAVYQDSKQRPSILHNLIYIQIQITNTFLQSTSYFTGFTEKSKGKKNSRQQKSWNVLLGSTTNTWRKLTEIRRSWIKRPLRDGKSDPLPFHSADGRKLDKCAHLHSSSL